MPGYPSTSVDKAVTVIRGRASLLAIRIDGDIVHRATRRKGILERLRQISESLAAFYGWEAADATTYVLTGAVPRVPAIKGDVRLKFPLPAGSRLCSPLTRRQRRGKSQPHMRASATDSSDVSVDSNRSTPN